MSLYYAYNINKQDVSSSQYFSPIKYDIISGFNKKIFTNNINIIFNTCDINVYGFNNSNDEYWGKKMVSNICIFHFTLSIIDMEDGTSQLKLTMLHGKKEEIKKLINKFLAIAKLIDML